MHPLLEIGVVANNLASGTTVSILLALRPIIDEGSKMAKGKSPDPALEMPRRRQLLDATELGALIRLRRVRLGIAQLELASAAGIDAGNLSKIERGSRRSHLDTYLRLCSLLGIDLFAELRP